MSVPIRSRQSHHDQIARAHHRAGMMRATAIAAVVAVTVIGLGWVFLFSPVFAVTDIRVSGAQMIGNDAVRAVVQELLDRRTLQMFQPARNIVLLSADVVGMHVRSAMESIQAVSVSKVYPHTLDVSVTERVAFGLWCRTDTCTYFDRTGARWGSAVPSRGPLLVRVQDERTDSEVPAHLISGMLEAIDGLPRLGIRAISITLPDSAPGDTRIVTDKKYALLMDTYGDVTDQLATLEVLLSERAKEHAWTPEYIDLRTPGRAYYRDAIDK